MKSNMTLNELAAEITRQAEQRKDYIAPTDKLRPVVVAEQDVYLGGMNGQALPLTDHAHGQMATRLGIPMRYYRRMQAEEPTLLAHNIDTWLRKQGDRVMVRTLDGQVRAIMSDKYQPFDHNLMLNAALPALHEAGRNMEITSLVLTDRRMYLQVVDHRREGEVKPGDVVRAGFVLSNSEIGEGAFSMEDMVWRLVCSNGLVQGKALNRYHVGRRAETGEDGVAYAADTQRADAQALLLKLRDTLQHVLSPEAFERRLLTLREAAGMQITRPLTEVVEVTAKQLTLNESEANNVLQFLARGGDFSKWGLVNAITRTAQEVDGDRAYELERAAGGVIEMSQGDWGEYFMKKAA